MFDDIGCLAGQQVQESEFVLIRSLRFLVVRGENAKGFSRPRNQRRGLDSAYTHFKLRCKSAARENRALLQIFNDDALIPLKRHPRSALTIRHTIPEINPPL